MKKETEKYVDPETWQALTPKHEDSWWPAWQDWLGRHSSSRISMPSLGSSESGYPPLDDAPGTYVLQE
jgi:polyhydroxyalkanoate synthase